MKNKSEDLNIKLLPFKIESNSRGRNTVNQYGVDMIKARDMWKESNKGSGVRIAVIDSGCDIYHESLKNNIVEVRNFTNEDNKNPNIVTDRVGHGTHVIGTIVANNPNNNIVGIAPSAQIYALKAIEGNGLGKLSWVVNAINYAVEKKVDIISMSLGMGGSSDKLERAVKEAVKKGILVVCAAGNSGDGNADSFEYSYPAAYEEVISVGAVDKKGNPASFSNANLVIDVIAPGVEILSTYPNNKYEVLSGTSMATPHVTGSLALLKNWSREEFQRDLSETELYAQLIKHTKSINYPRTIQGNGLVYLAQVKTKNKKKN
ncbi:S8 family peptidase [Romboutsia hominis]|uniref:S8 family peptidase n=1 Tax=Romboutsia hominis TaxID=1507512 RepID=UPI001F0653B7|nr:S8 family peptidase [Romboutsia hominis]MCH1959529.1 S8 family peptidase [Romboutsia hominis]MCH1970049.1 S8 family peptidase [Romboutsia hominis]